MQKLKNAKVHTKRVMNINLLEILPDELLNLIFQNYIYKVRGRILLRQLREVIKFSRGEPSLLLSDHCWILFKRY